MIHALLSLLLASSALEDGVRALDEFRLDDAIALLEAAASEGHRPYDEWILVLEKLGVAYAYKGREADAIATFERLLAIDPTHALRYNLSPKATLPFEAAREKARELAPLTLEVAWPRDASPEDALRLTIDVVADPGHLIVGATLHWRARGEPNYHSAELDLAAPERSFVIPAPAEDPEADVVYQLFVVARDQAGNEVARWADARRPREILLRYHPPAIYERWWVWAIAGVILAAGSATTYALTRRPSDTYDVEVHR